VFDKIYKWLDNYWYHYKWQTLIAVFFIVFAVVAVGQMITKTDEDVVILYAGPFEPTPNQAREISNALQTVMSSDFNGDGEKNAQVMNILLMTEDQIQQAKKEADEQGKVVVYNNALLNENRTKFATQIFAGEAVICLLDPNWYPNVLKSGGFVKLADILGIKPGYAIDDYSVYLHDTPLARYFTALQSFPEDTILCVRTMSTATVFKSAKKEKIRYENQLQMFRDMMSFSIAE
jgi:hypothetical protein